MERVIERLNGLSGLEIFAYIILPLVILFGMIYIFSVIIEKTREEKKQNLIQAFNNGKEIYFKMRKNIATEIAIVLSNKRWKLKDNSVFSNGDTFITVKDLLSNESLKIEE